MFVGGLVCYGMLVKLYFAVLQCVAVFAKARADS